MLTGKQLLSASLALAVSFSAYATTDTSIVVAPSCLIAAAGFTPKIMASNNKLALIEINQLELNKLSDAKHQTKTACGGFLNVTTEWQHNQTKSLQKTDSAAFLASFAASPQKLQQRKDSYTIRYEKEANQLISQLNPTLMWETLTTFSSHKDRYANSDSGVAAAKWIGTQIETIAKNAGRNDVTVQYVKTNRYKQPSVVAKLGNGKGPGIVIGAHLDTTESITSNRPGADDDGSGSMTVLESARTIIASGTTFNKPIYFVWYAAEEEGLVGSRAVVADFQKKNIPVDAVMHFDMTGFAYKNQSTIWIIDDYVDDGLTAFLEKIITTYTKRDIAYTRCGYACSDHASWTDAGFKAVIPAEARFEDTNPVMHSARDTMDRLSITHMTDYAKIATAFAVELAEPAA